MAQNGMERGTVTFSWGNLLKIASNEDASKAKPRLAEGCVSAQWVGRHAS
jgi:hypothetical protein